MKELRLNDQGTILKVLVKDPDGNVVDISSTTVRKFLIRKPDRTYINVTATFWSDGTDGYLRYSVSSGDLNQLGIYELQTYIETVAAKLTSSIVRFKVTEVINS